MSYIHFLSKIFFMTKWTEGLFILMRRNVKIDQPVLISTLLVSIFEKWHSIFCSLSHLNLSQVLGVIWKHSQCIQLSNSWHPQAVALIFSRTHLIGFYPKIYLWVLSKKGEDKFKTLCSCINAVKISWIWSSY